MLILKPSPVDEFVSWINKAYMKLIPNDIEIFIGVDLAEACPEDPPPVMLFRDNDNILREILIDSYIPFDEIIFAITSVIGELLSPGEVENKCDEIIAAWTEYCSVCEEAGKGSENCTHIVMRPNRNLCKLEELEN